MPRINLLAPPSSPPPAIFCATCSKPMRLVTVKPHPRYLNTGIHNDGCDRGLNESFVVAHKD